MRIEDLAEDAEVSVGTVYNYYRTKGDILIATVTMEVEEVLEVGRGIVERPPDGAETAIRELILTYYDHSLQYLSKEMWRTAMALSIGSPDTPNGRRYTELDQRLCAQVSDLIKVLRARGDLRAEIDADAIGQVLFNNLNMLFIEFVKDDAMSLAHLRSVITTQIRQLARLMAAEGAAR